MNDVHEARYRKSTPPSRLLQQTRVVAVLRAGRATEYAPVVEALAKGGLRSVELTLSTAGVIEELPKLIRDFGGGIELGVGTVTTAAQAEVAIEAGAAYLVTPVTETDVIDVAMRRGVPVYPGGFTPTEVHRAWAAGATAVKLFPASMLGPSYISHLWGPFPGIEVIPSGGVGMEDAADWIRAGAMAVSLGGPLVQDAFKGGSLEDLASRTREVLRLVDEAVATR